MLKETVLSLFVILILSSVAMAQGSVESFMDQFQWDNRIMLIFASGEDDQKYQDQITELKGHEDGLSDRDLIIFHLVEGTDFYQETDGIGSKLRDKFYESYKVMKDNFTVILIGKDGTEKLRQSKPLATDTLFSVIDAMPMRQREMKQNK